MPGAEERFTDRRVEADQRRAEPAEGEREADEEEADEAEAEDGEVRRHDVRRVLRPAEAGLDEREPGLHEDDQDGADDDPEQVDLLAEHRDRVGFLGVGDGREQCDCTESCDRAECESKRTFAHEVPPCRAMKGHPRSAALPPQVAAHSKKE